MKPHILTALATACLFSLPAAAGEKLAVLKLSDGTEYKAVEIMGVSAKGVRILHHSGAANVPVNLLPADLQKKYGADQAKAAEDAAAKAKEEAEKPAPAAPEKPAPAAVPKMPAVPAAPPAPDAPAPAPLLEIASAKLYGIAEVMAEKFKLDGKVVRLDVIANSASKIEQISKDECQIFVGDPFTKLDSDYAFVRFPEAGRKKIETMLSGSRGRMTFYVLVQASEAVPLKAVGRSTVSGAAGTPLTFRW